MHSLQQALLRPAEAEVGPLEPSEKEDSVASVEEEVRTSLERVAFILGRVRRQSAIVRYSEFRPHRPPLPS
jgi:hypothetical protein